MIKKTVPVSGFSKEQRKKELEKVKVKYEKKGYKFIEFFENGIAKSVAIFEVNEAIAKKEKSKNLIIIGVFFLIIASILYFKAEDTKTISINKDLKTFNVSDYKYTLDNKPAISISIGESKDNYVDLSILRKDVKNNFSIDTRDNKDKKIIDIVATWNGNTYFQNKKEASFVNVKILELDKTNNIAKFSIKAKLFSSTNNNSFKINTTTIIKDKQFQNLLINF
ncbi:hypothetical protein [Malaciobacter marinus]|uniref:hypothetical protein n=1 Tax=Malaciobacter marinus TaxID=505249 RepID=UPI003B0019FC